MKIQLIKWGCRDSHACSSEDNRLELSGVGERPDIYIGFLELQKREDPDILFFPETKLDNNRLEKFRIKLGLMHMVAKDCNGQSGELELFWRCGVNLNLRWKGRMHIDATII